MTTDSAGGGEDRGRPEVLADKLKQLRTGRFAEDPLTAGEIETVAQQLIDLLKGESTLDEASS